MYKLYKMAALTYLCLLLELDCLARDLSHVLVRSLTAWVASLAVNDLIFTLGCVFTCNLRLIDIVQDRDCGDFLLPFYFDVKAVANDHFVWSMVQVASILYHSHVCFLLSFEAAG